MNQRRTNAPVVEATADAALRIYERMERNLALVRRTLGRPLTLSEKLLLGHLDGPQADLVPGESYLTLRPDRVVFQDVLGQTAMLAFMETGRPHVAVPTTIHCDHLVQARTDGLADLRASADENREVYDFLRSAASKFGAGFHPPGAGIIHQVVLERYAFPGELIIGTDSHTPNAGGVGACAVGVGGSDAVEVIAGLPWELLYPRRIAVRLLGALSGWTAPKDVILHLAGRLGVSGATNAILEYVGPGARTLSATGKATICNMGAELGATTSVFPSDACVVRYLRGTGRDPIAAVVERFAHLFEPDPEAESEPAAHYDQAVEIDLSRLEPHVVGPHSPDRARPISAFAAEVRDASSGFPEVLSAALIGSCTNSSYQDLTRAADVAAQGARHGVVAAVPFFVTPGSEAVRTATERDGQLGALERAGATVLANACGPCIGQWRRSDPAASAPNAILTSYNRNFQGRNDGRATTLAFIASPEIVTAFALARSLSYNPLTDELVGSGGERFRLEPPKPAPDVPEIPLSQSAGAYVAPDPEGAGDIVLDARSERLARLPRWPAWDGKDFVDLPVLVKTRGKTTTDQISPAGTWLRYRGHLERFSDNLLMGASNAFTGEVGRTTNVVMREAGAISEVARDYRARGIRWVIVGDANYGEGSSREHAALSPRLLGGVAVIARSFARIHETNLKKQGLLALTFADPADYDHVRAGDRLSLVQLAALSPGVPVRCVVQHADGSEETILLRHSYGATQVEWFRAGSALNAARREAHP
jgi:aconitate hydratase